VRRQYSDRLAWWSGKIGRRAEVCFGPAVARYATGILTALNERSDRTVEASVLAALGTRLGIPLKFLSRTLAVTNRTSS